MRFLRDFLLPTIYIGFSTIFPFAKLHTISTIPDACHTPTAVNPDKGPQHMSNCGVYTQKSLLTNIGISKNDVPLTSEIRMPESCSAKPSLQPTRDWMLANGSGNRQATFWGLNLSLWGLEVTDRFASRILIVSYPVNILGMCSDTCLLLKNSGNSGKLELPGKALKALQFLND